jgi:Amt family ammonium transporter
MVGMILTAVFADKLGLIYGESATFITHLYALGIVALFTLVGSYLLYSVAHLIIPLRVSSEEEDIGLDLSQHGESLDPAPSLQGSVLGDAVRREEISLCCGSGW